MSIVQRGARCCLDLSAAFGLPTACLLCNAPAASTPNLCDACRDALPWLGVAARCKQCMNPTPAGSLCGLCLHSPPPFTHTHAALAYRWPVEHLVARLKYRNCAAAARTLGELLADSLAPTQRRQTQDRNWAPLLVPVPLHSRRLAERGYNQSMRLASVVARRLALECKADALVRQRDTAPQASVPSAAQRAANLAQAFVATAPSQVHGRHVALLDDVMTSTSTVRAASHALLEAGAVSVEVWALARAASG